MRCISFIHKIKYTFKKGAIETNELTSSTKVQIKVDLIVFRLFLKHCYIRDGRSSLEIDRYHFTMILTKRFKNNARFQN